MEHNATEHMNRETIKERVSDIDKRLRTLEWDKRNNQLNAGMEARYTELKEEKERLSKELEAES
jgi:hypothetical protein